jgi:hypothetical protein
MCPDPDPAVFSVRSHSKGPLHPSINRTFIFKKKIQIFDLIFQNTFYNE